MTRSAKKGKACCDASLDTVSCCRVESLVTVDERGQMVLPKELRERAGIGPGEKLVVVSFEREGEICCINLIRAAQFSVLVRDMLGPVMKEAL